MVSDLQFKKGIELKTFEKDGAGQQEVIAEVLKYRSGILKAPPRFGKTVVTVYLTTQYRLKTLIIIHQKDLLTQFYNEFIAFTNFLEIRSPQKHKKDATGQIIGFFNDYTNPEELDICLLCWQTLGSKNGPARIAKFRDSFGLNIYDECHKGGAYKYASVINRLNPMYRLGLTGTVERVDKKQKLVLDIVGPVIAKGQVKQVPCAVTVVHTQQPVKYDLTEPLPWLHKRLYNNTDRLKIVLKYLKEDIADGAFICIGFHRCSQQQLQEFTDILKYMGIKAEAFHGAMKRGREEVLNEFRNGDVQVAVCNEAMLTGVNVPRWNVYYSMFPTSNVCYEEQLDGTKELSGNFVQNFSRPRTIFWYTPTMQKKMALIRDFVDDNPHCKRAYQKRLKAYKHENFIIEHFYETNNSGEDICGNRK
jgi:superfamily II DNA or RNA helicase